jgi:hypothetical protein
MVGASAVAPWFVCPVKRRIWRQLIAVVAGNLIYLVVEPYLPVRGQHQLNQIDLGLAVDFWICLVCYGLVRMVWRDG